MRQGVIMLVLVLALAGVIAKLPKSEAAQDIRFAIEKEEVVRPGIYIRVIYDNRENLCYTVISDAHGIATLDRMAFCHSRVNEP